MDYDDRTAAHPEEPRQAAAGWELVWRPAWYMASSIAQDRQVAERATRVLDQLCFWR